MANNVGGKALVYLQRNDDGFQNGFVMRVFGILETEDKMT